MPRLPGSASRSLNFSGQPANTQTRYGASVSLSYLLWDFGARSGTLEQGKFELISAQLIQDQTLQDVILQVEQAYYQVLGLQAVVEVNRQSLKDAQTNLEAAQDRRASGLATVGDVYKAEAALAGAKLAVQQTEGQLASARGALATAIGETPDTNCHLQHGKTSRHPEMPAQSVASLMMMRAMRVPNCSPPRRRSRPPPQNWRRSVAAAAQPQLGCQCRPHPGP